MCTFTFHIFTKSGHYDKKPVHLHIENLDKCACTAMKHGYLKNGAVFISDTSWVFVLFGYFCMRPPSVPKLKKKKFIFFHFFPLDMSHIFFSFGYVTKIDKSNENSEKMNFKCNYMDVQFFYLLF